jgi:AraC-like DNA-binding protein
MAESDNLAAWMESTSTLFEIDLGRGGERPFHADLESFAMGSILFGRTRSTAQTFRRTAETIARSGVDHILVQLYEAGGYEGFAGSRPITVAAGDICVLDCGETLETHATDFQNLTLVIPRSMIEPHLSNPFGLHGLVLTGSTPLGQVLARHMEALFCYAPLMTFDECEAVTDGSISLIAACIRGELEMRDRETGGVATISMMRIRRHIDANLADPKLSIDRIAKDFGLSRASLYRLFEPLGGIADYIRRKRLHKAFFDLTAPRMRDKRISEIARRWCFQSESSFSRSFRATYGISPSVAREASTLSRKARTQAEGESRDMLTRWMREIAADGTPREKRPKAT